MKAPQCRHAIRLLLQSFDVFTQDTYDTMLKMSACDALTQAEHDAAVQLFEQGLRSVDRRMTLMAEAVEKYGTEQEQDLFAQLDERLALLRSMCTLGVMPCEFGTNHAILRTEAYLFRTPLAVAGCA